VAVCAVEAEKNLKKEDGNGEIDGRRQDQLDGSG
jgi:hypothetical protein